MSTVRWNGPQNDIKVRILMVADGPSSVCNHDHPMIAFTSKSKSMQSSAVKILGADKKQVATPLESRVG